VEKTIAYLDKNSPILPSTLIKPITAPIANLKAGTKTVKNTITTKRSLTHDLQKRRISHEESKINGTY
jgi:hypothetical protein